MECSLYIMVSGFLGFYVHSLFSSCPSLMDTYYEKINEHIEQLHLNFENAIVTDDYGKTHYDKANNTIDTFISKNLEVDIHSKKADYLRNYIHGRFRNGVVNS